MNRNIVNQVKAIEAILTTRTLTEASKVSGIPLRTLQNWMKHCDFQFALEDAQNDIVQTCSKRLLLLNEKAIETLEDLLDNPLQPQASIKLKIASKTIELATRYRAIAIAEKNQSATEFDQLNRDVHTEYRSDYSFAYWLPSNSGSQSNQSEPNNENQELWIKPDTRVEELDTNSKI